MLIRVKSVTGRELEFDVTETQKVGELKKLIEGKLGISPEQQRLLFNGRPMNDDKTFSEQHCAAGSIVHLVLALRGGL